MRKHPLAETGLLSELGRHARPGVPRPRFGGPDNDPQPTLFAAS